MLLLAKELQATKSFSGLVCGEQVGNAKKEHSQCRARSGAVRMGMKLGSAASAEMAEAKRPKRMLTAKKRKERDCARGH